MSNGLTILQGDSLEHLREMPDASVQCAITSPPYWGLRDYGVEGQIGLEKTPDLYVAKLVAVFAEVKRVLRDGGTLWLNLGDSYAGSGNGLQNASNGMGQRVLRDRAEVVKFSKSKRMERGSGRWGGGNNPAIVCKSKDLIGIPWMVAFALRADGWYLRSDIIWAKPNCMPESVTDRPTRSHEYLFLLSKSAKYFYDADAIKEPCSESSIERISQPNFENQTGGLKDPLNGNRSHRKTLTNWASNALPDKQCGHSRRHDGFNDRWDQMERVEQCSGMRNKRDVWTVPPACYKGAHFATFPPDLIKPCIMAGSKPGDTVLDPFGGSGTTGQVALELGRKAVLIELNPDYVSLIEQRTNTTPGLPL